MRKLSSTRPVSGAKKARDHWISYVLKYSLSEVTKWIHAWTFNWEGVVKNTELQNFILILKLTVSLNFLAPDEKKTKPQIKKHWQWEVATCSLGTEAKQKTQASEGSELQRGRLAKGAQRADGPSSLSRDNPWAARSQPHTALWGWNPSHWSHGQISHPYPGQVLHWRNGVGLTRQHGQGNAGANGKKLTNTYHWRQGTEGKARGWSQPTGH